MKLSTARKEVAGVELATDIEKPATDDENPATEDENPATDGENPETLFSRYRDEILVILFCMSPPYSLLSVWPDEAELDATMSWVLYGSETVFPLLVEDTSGAGLGLSHAWTGWFLVAQGFSWCFFQVRTSNDVV